MQVPNTRSLVQAWRSQRRSRRKSRRAAVQHIRRQEPALRRSWSARSRQRDQLCATSDETPWPAASRARAARACTRHVDALLAPPEQRHHGCVTIDIHGDHMSRAKAWQRKNKGAHTSQTPQEVYFCIFGNQLLVPIKWMCKKQTGVSHSSTETDIIS